MIKLSHLKALIDAYLLENGDKEVISFGSCFGGSNALSIHLLDIPDGSPEMILKRDAIYVPIDPPEDLTPVPMVNAFEMLKYLTRADADLRTSAIRGALFVMQQSGAITKKQADDLWIEYALDEPEKLYRKTVTVDD